MDSIRVGVFDPHEMVRLGLTQWINDAPDMSLVFALSDANELRRALREQPCDIIVTEWKAHVPTGNPLKSDVINVLPIIGEANVHFIVYTAYATPAAEARAMAERAILFLSKNTRREQLLEAIRHAALPATIPIKPLKRTRTGAASDPIEDIPLTNREIQVLRHVVLGFSNREIGHSLDISIETVKEHVANILQKLEASDRTEAAVWAVRKGLA